MKEYIVKPNEEIEKFRRHFGYAPFDTTPGVKVRIITFHNKTEGIFVIGFRGTEVFLYDMVSHIAETFREDEKKMCQYRLFEKEFIDKTSNTHFVLER